MPRRCLFLLFPLLSLLLLAWLWWPQRPATDLYDLGGDARPLLTSLPHVLSVSRSAPWFHQPTGRVVHFLDYHLVPSWPPGGSDLAQARHILLVEAVQGEIADALVSLQDLHGVEVVLAEGLTERNLEGWKREVRLARTTERSRSRTLLTLGSVGMAEIWTRGELVAMPLEDAEAHAAADPERTGRSHGPEWVARERAMMDQIQGYAAPVAVIVLGADHDLSALCRARGMDYYRVEVAAFCGAMRWEWGR